MSRSSGCGAPQCRANQHSRRAELVLQVPQPARGDHRPARRPPERGHPRRGTAGTAPDVDGGPCVAREKSEPCEDVLNVMRAIEAITIVSASHPRRLLVLIAA